MTHGTLVGQCYITLTPQCHQSVVQTIVDVNFVILINKALNKFFHPYKIIKFHFPSPSNKMT